MRRYKGKLTRLRLKEAAIDVLDRVGYHQMRIKDITAQAGVAAGLFYHYFKDLNELVNELLDEHIALFDATEEIEKGVDKGDWFNRLRKLKLSGSEMAEWLAALYYRGLFARNPPRIRLRHAEKILSIKR